MTELFGRKYSVRIGRRQVNTVGLEGSGVTASEFQPQLLFASRWVPKTLREREFRQWTDVQVVANITYNKSTNGGKKTPNTVDLYNLDPDDEEFILEGDIILIEGGYDQDNELPSVFTGEVISKFVESTSPNRIVKLVVGESYQALRDVRISRSWGPLSYLESGNPLSLATTAHTIILGFIEEIKNAGIDFGSDETVATFSPQLQSFDFKSGWIIEGNLFYELTQFLNATKLGLYWYISQDTLYIEPKGQLPVTEAFIVEEENLSGPIKQIRSQASSQHGSKVSTGLVIPLLLDGRVTLNKKIQLNFGLDAGTYRILGITHKMNYEGTKWETQVLCEREAITYETTT